MAEKLSAEMTRKLIDLAAEARHNARVPNSGFHVGAALLCEGDAIVTGCNMELAHMLESICAERCAIVKANSMGYRQFRAIAVVSDAPRPISPCSICRQTLVDFGLDWPVIMSNADASEVVTMTVGELVPFAFLGTGAE